MTSPRKAPTPLRIPEEWELEIEEARARQEAKAQEPVSKHSWLLKAIRRVLDAEPGARAVQKAKSKAAHPTSSKPLAGRPVEPNPKKRDAPK